MCSISPSFIYYHNGNSLHYEINEGRAKSYKQLENMNVVAFVVSKVWDLCGESFQIAHCRCRDFVTILDERGFTKQL